MALSAARNNPITDSVVETAHHERKGCRDAWNHRWKGSAADSGCAAEGAAAGAGGAEIARDARGLGVVADPGRMDGVVGAQGANCPFVGEGCGGAGGRGDASDRR